MVEVETNTLTVKGKGQLRVCANVPEYMICDHEKNAWYHNHNGAVKIRDMSFSGLSSDVLYILSIEAMLLCEVSAMTVIELTINMAEKSYQEFHSLQCRKEFIYVGGGDPYDRFLVIHKCILEHQASLKVIDSFRLEGGWNACPFVVDGNDLLYLYTPPLEWVIIDGNSMREIRRIQTSFERGFIAVHPDGTLITHTGTPRNFTVSQYDGLNGKLINKHAGNYLYDNRFSGRVTCTRNGTVIAGADKIIMLHDFKTAFVAGNR